jgi:pimeloyl-ACP methyl ester carboxylesterase
MQTSLLAHESQGSGRPVVLLHGFPFHRGQWHALARELGEHAHVIAPDLRGFGESAFRDVLPDRSWTMEQHADDVAALLDALSVRTPITLFGFSMGGYVALAFLRRHAARVGALGLINTRAIADSQEAAAGRATLAAKALAEGPGPVIEAMLPRLLAPQTLAKRPEVAAAVRTLMEVAPREGSAASLRGMALRADSSELLPLIGVPTLVLVGEHDAISSPTEMAGIARAIPGARFTQLPAAGHMTTHEAPAELALASLDFLRSL